MEDDCIICGRAYRTCPGHPNMRWDDTWGLVDDGPAVDTYPEYDEGPNPLLGRLLCPVESPHMDSISV